MGEESQRVVVEVDFIGSIIECLISSKSANVGGECIPFVRPLNNA